MHNKTEEGQALKRALIYLESNFPFSFNWDAISGRERDLDLEQVLRRSAVRYRSVRLRGEWFRHPSPPILAYDRDSGAPLVLYTDLFSRWICYNGATDRKVKVTKSMARSIAEDAFVLYRPLPERSLRRRDLLFYGLQGRKSDLVIISFLSGVLGLLGIAIPLATGVVYDQILPHDDMSSLLQIGLALLLAALAGAMFQWTQGLAINRLSVFLSAPLEAALWDRVMSLPSRFFKGFAVGDLGARLFGIRGVQGIVTSTLVTLSTSSFAMMLNLILMFSVEPKLGFIAIFIWLFYMLVTSVGLYRQIQYQRPLSKAENKMSARSLDVIRAISRIKIHGAEVFAFRNWAAQYVENKSLNLAAKKASILVSAFNRGFSTLSVGSFIWVVTQMPEGQISVGQFLSFSAAFGFFLSSTTSISDSIIKLGLCLPNLEQLEPVLQELPEPKQGKTLPGKLSGGISLSNVSFSYSTKQKPILNSLTLDIEAGSFVAIVGTSGAGKSTLLRLLLGFESPDSGDIFYDQSRMRDLDVEEIRRQLGVVLQNGSIMPGSIIENIIGATACSRDQAIDACKLAGIHDDIDAMPMAYETIVREGLLSGGQQQRLLIARAIVNKPKILFFDEATSALDNQTQKMVSESIDSLNATRVVIAHRLSTIQNADKIVVLDQGKIVEQGTFDDLMNHKGLFFKLAERQI